MLQGAARIDLNGNRVGTVTQDDEIAAQEAVKNIWDRKNQRRAEMVEAEEGRRIESLPMMRKPAPPPTLTIEAPKPAAVILKPADCEKALRTAVARIEMAATNLQDGECAAVVLRSAVEAIDRVIGILDERKSAA
jgi:sRNA-binding protein